MNGFTTHNNSSQRRIVSKSFGTGGFEMNTYKIYGNSSRTMRGFWMTETFCRALASGELPQKVLGVV